MATTAKLTIFVTSTRGASKVRVGTVGKYVSTPVNDIELTLAGQPLFSTASSKVFWQAVMAAATNAIAALP